MDPGAMLATTHAVDGLQLRLRLVRPSDAARLHALFERLTPASRRARLGGGAVEELVRLLTFYDPRERLVVAATTFLAGSEEILGVADVTLAETGLADLSMVVDDGFHGRGVGRLLAEATASLAQKNGAGRLRASMQRDNHAMLALMERLGRTVRVEEDGRLLAYTTLGRDARRAA